MASTSETIETLRGALATYTDERKLLELIDESLSLLRSRYRQFKAEFTDESIQFLKSLTVVRDVLREFIEAVEDKAWVHSRDDAQELACTFGELGERLTPHFVAKRAAKETRELLATAQSLPFAAVNVGQNDFRRRISQLEAAGKKCQKCGSKLALRESQHGYFWGCSTFPQCFGRQRLSREESQLLDQ
ncbi:MAG: topoisomerase DNA-binding C4 zinc finger domain-containing protein [Thiobacillus sp.]|nr:MAG: hypothetical protein B7X91_13410 [Hydrogenophilales bacterium 17-64-11]